MGRPARRKLLATEIEKMKGLRSQGASVRKLATDFGTGDRRVIGLVHRRLPRLPSTPRGGSFLLKQRTTIKPCDTTPPTGSKGECSSSVPAANTASVHSISTPGTATCAPRRLPLSIVTLPRCTTSLRRIHPSILSGAYGGRERIDPIRPIFNERNRLWVLKNSFAPNSQK